MTTNTFPLANFTAMGQLVDAAAVNGCLESGMIVIVETDGKGFVSGIVSAHTSREQARAAWLPVQDDNHTAIIFPTSRGPHIYYNYLLTEEFNELCSL